MEFLSQKSMHRRTFLRGLSATIALPYLDAMEYAIIPSVSTRILGFITGKFDLISLQPPLVKDVQSQAPQASCDLVPDNAARVLLLNRAVPPFDNPDLRRALTLSLDRKAFVEILTQGQGRSAAPCFHRRKASGECRPRC